MYMDMPRLSVIVPIIPFMATEYGLVDKINHTRGVIDSFDAVYPQLKDLDFITQAPKAGSAGLSLCRAQRCERNVHDRRGIL